jgi:hypothetical protein
LRSGEVLHRVEEEYPTIRKVHWIGHIWHRNRLLKHFIEGNIEGSIEVTEKRRRTRKQLLDDLKEMRGYFKLKEEALDRSMWRSRFGRVYGPVVRQTTKFLNGFKPT